MLRIGVSCFLAIGGFNKIFGKAWLQLGFSPFLYMFLVIIIILVVVPILFLFFHQRAEASRDEPRGIYRWGGVRWGSDPFPLRYTCLECGASFAAKDTGGHKIATGHGEYQSLYTCVQCGASVPGEDVHEHVRATHHSKYQYQSLLQRPISGQGQPTSGTGTQRGAGFCAYCGAENPGSSKFCGECGNGMG
jgi:DNA-directed RNA polymerase subunit RPC12/RpoP